jgi:hypothetical protein
MNLNGEENPEFRECHYGICLVCFDFDYYGEANEIWDLSTHCEIVQ